MVVKSMPFTKMKCTRHKISRDGRTLTAVVEVATVTTSIKYSKFQPSRSVESKRSPGSWRERWNLGMLASSEITSSVGGCVNYACISKDVKYPG